MRFISAQAGFPHEMTAGPTLPTAPLAAYASPLLVGNTLLTVTSPDHLADKCS